MNPNCDLRAVTAQCFENVNFSDLNEKWVDEVIISEFTDAEENEISLSILFVTEPKKTLVKLADLCVAWCQKSTNDESLLSNDPNISANREVLWTVLDEMEISANQIQALIYLLCTKAVKKDACLEDKALGLASAKLYFSCLLVPGCAAYSMYHTNLFNLCIDSLPVYDFTTDISAGRALQNLSSIFISTLLSLIPVLRDFYLGDDSSTLEYAVVKLCELAALEIQSHINFSMNYSDKREQDLRHHKPSLVVSALAYQALSSIFETDLNGDKDSNYMLILSHLNKHILCVKAKKSPTVSQKIITIKDNAVNYVCHNLKTKDFCSEVTQLAVKRVCLAVTDKAEIRNAVSAAVIVILFHMEPEHLTEMIEWILSFIDSTDTKDRVFSLEILNHLLSKIDGAAASQTPDCFKDDSFITPIVFAVLTRCDDVSPVVRTRALSILSQNMKCILQFLDRTKEQDTFEIKDSEDISDKDLDVNGNHRYFWYNLESFRERLNEIAAILQRRVEDKNVNARKAAVIVLENIIVFDLTYMTEENIKFFDSAAKDPNLLVRKQVVQSLSLMLESYRENIDIKECWLRCVMPLINDAEMGVQSKALSVLEDIFLSKVFSSKQEDRECVFSLLKLMSSGDFMAYQRFLQQAFSLWNSENKLRSQSVVHLEKYVGTEWEECIWFYISNFALFKPIPLRTSILCVDHLEKFVRNEKYPDFTEYIMKVLMHTISSLHPEKLKVIENIVCESLESFLVPVWLIPAFVEIFFKIVKFRRSQAEEERKKSRKARVLEKNERNRKKSKKSRTLETDEESTEDTEENTKETEENIEETEENTDKTETEFEKFSVTMVEKCLGRLKEIKKSKSFPKPPSEDLLAKYFSTVKEFCHLNVSNVKESVTDMLKSFCIAPPKELSKVLSPGTKAHAFAALGKICLQDELLAKNVLPQFVKELITSKYDVVRNNVVIILIEMCKCHTSFADRYLPLISFCFKDKLYLIRYQTVVLVVNLLQEGYVKWRGPLFFCLLSTLNDKKEVIQEIGRYSFMQLVADKKKSLFSEHFIDSIFVFNNFTPPDNANLGQTVKELERFSLPGEHKREERMNLFKFLLDSMEIKDRMKMVESICDIIVNVSESIYPPGKETECIIRDCFAILTCQEIRVFDADQAEDGNDCEENNLAKTELDMRKLVIIGPVIPVIVSLKDSISDPKSDLMNDIILFLKDLLHDFRDNMKDILAIDKVLLLQLELQLKKDAEREKAEKKREKISKDKNRQISNRNPEEPQELDLRLSIHPLMKDPSIDVSKVKENMVEHPAKKASPSKSPTTPRHIRHTKQTPQKSVHRGILSTSHQASTSVPNHANDTEVVDQRLVSTPRVVLTDLNAPLSRNILNVSAIDREHEPMTIDSDDD